METATPINTDERTAISDTLRNSLRMKLHMEDYIYPTKRALASELASLESEFEELQDKLADASNKAGESEEKLLKSATDSKLPAEELKKIAEIFRKKLKSKKSLDIKLNTIRSKISKIEPELGKIAFAEAVYRYKHVPILGLGVKTYGGIMQPLPAYTTTIISKLKSAGYDIVLKKRANNTGDVASDPNGRSDDYTYNTYHLLFIPDSKVTDVETFANAVKEIMEIIVYDEEVLENYNYYSKLSHFDNEIK